MILQVVLQVTFDLKKKNISRLKRAHSQVGGLNGTAGPQEILNVKNHPPTRQDTKIIYIYIVY